MPTCKPAASFLAALPPPHIRQPIVQQGQSAVYVQRQLGHASIKLTVDTYGKWLPMGNKAAADGLDDASGSKMVAKNRTGYPRCGGSSRFNWWAVKDSNLGPAD